MLSDRNQIQKTINCDSIYMKFLEKTKSKQISGAENGKCKQTGMRTVFGIMLSILKLDYEDCTTV